MPDRATYLSRVLLSRLRGLDVVLSDIADEREKNARRQELVSKILAVEAGVVDGSTVQLVAAAMPVVDSGRTVSDREQQELAAFLRKQLPLESSAGDMRGSRSS